MVACVGGGSNAIGMFNAFLEDKEVGEIRRMGYFGWNFEFSQLDECLKVRIVDIHGPLYPLSWVLRLGCLRKAMNDNDICMF